MKFTKKQQGVISVFLSLILLLTFLFSGVVIDGGRIYAARNIVSGAGQLSLNAGLSNYDTALKDAYGLIAMSETPEELQANLKTYFVDSLSACGITEADYNTALVFLEMAASEENFSAEGVENTQICQGYVMEQQVLDYMKYRAPITVGTGILEKLKSVKEMEQAKVVANDEVETGKALNDVQKLLEKLKKLVDEEVEMCNEFHDFSETKLENIKKLSKGITAGELVIYGYEKYNETKNAGDLEETLNQFNTLSANLMSVMTKTDTAERNASVYDSLLEMKGYYLTLKDVSEDDFMEFWKGKYNLNETTADSEEDAESEESEEDNAAATAALLQNGKQLYQDYTINRDNFLKVPEQIKKQVENDLKAVSEESKQLYEDTESGKEKEQDVINQIDKIEKKLDDVEDKLNTWKEDSKSLTNEGLKEQVKKNQDQYDILLSEETGMGTMKEYSESNKDYFEKFLEYLNNAEFCNIQLKQVNANQSAVKAEIDSHAGRAANGSSIRSFVNSTDFYYILPIANPDEKFNHVALKDLSKTEFYTYLEECCGKSKKKDKIKEANSDIQGQLESVLKELKTLFTSDDLAGVATKLNDVQGGLPSKALANTSEKKEVEPNNTDIDSSSKRDTTMNDALDVLNKDNATLSGMANLAAKASDGIESIIEPIYITEYVMNMYSYYTIDKTGKKTSEGKWEAKPKSEILSLSDYKLYEDLIYRAEAEYILWGNKKDVRDNVGTTKAVIFAIQFIGNLMYALTQPYVTDGAKEIGAFFVHKVVSIVVQLVVEVVVALVETVRDMIILVNGGSVVPFKILTDGGAKKQWKTKLCHATDIASWDMTKDTTAEGELLAFSYRDYLWMILCIKCLGNGRYDVLVRCADLAQENIAQSKKDGDKAYRLMDEYTMLKIDADVKMDTWLVTDIFAPEKAGLDTSGTFTLKYKGIQGY